MENFIPVVFDLLTLLAETYKIYLRNGRLMVFIALLIISLQSLLYLFNFFSIKPLITDLMIKLAYQLALATPGSPEFVNLVIAMQKDFEIFVVVEWGYLLVSAIATVFFATSTIYASALIYGGKMIHIKDLVSWTVRSLKRPFLTFLYISLFVLGYFTLCFAIVFPLGLILAVAGHQLTSSVPAILLIISATVFMTYLSVVWNLSLVISVLEEKFGIEALGKAAQIVKGMKLQGFILNLLLNIICLILIQCLRLVKLNQPEAIQIVIAMVAFSSVWILNMFGHVAYTVLYYRCKKSHGEELELQAAGVEYTKVPTAPVINENIP